MPLIASTSLVFRRRRMGYSRRGALLQSYRTFPAILLAFVGRSLRLRLAIFLQLVVQRLQANAKDFRRTRLIVVGGFQRLDDEQALRLTYRSTDAKSNCIGFENGWLWSDLSEARGQVTGLNHGSLAHDDRALQNVTQFANIAWPRVSGKYVHH